MSLNMSYLSNDKIANDSVEIERLESMFIIFMDKIFLTNNSTEYNCFRPKIRQVYMLLVGDESSSNSNLGCSLFPEEESVS